MNIKNINVHIGEIYMANLERESTIVEIKEIKGDNLVVFFPLSNSDEEATIHKSTLLINGRLVRATLE